MFPMENKIIIFLPKDPDRILADHQIARRDRLRRFAQDQPDGERADVVDGRERTDDLVIPERPKPSKRVDDSDGGLRTEKFARVSPTRLPRDERRDQSTIRRFDRDRFRRIGHVGRATEGENQQRRKEIRTLMISREFRQESPRHRVYGLSVIIV